MVRGGDSTRRTSAYGSGASAAGRDLHNVYNNYQTDTRREIAIESAEFQRILRDGAAVQSERDLLAAQVDELAEQNAAQAELLARMDDAVPASVHITRLGAAILASLVVGALMWAIVGPTKKSPPRFKAGPRVTVTAPRPSQTTIPSTTDESRPTLANGSIAITPAAMTCSTGQYFDRLSTAPAGPDSKLLAAYKLREIRSRMYVYKVRSTSTGMTPVPDACPGVASNLDQSSIIVWAGPFPDAAASRAYCAAMKFSNDPKVNWDCYPLPVR